MRKKLSWGLVLGYTSFGTDALVSLLLLPILIRYLGKTEAGIWMIFNSLGALLLSLSNGIGPVTVRAVANLAGRSTQDGFDLGEWGRLRRSTVSVYLGVLGFTLVAALVLGLVYLPHTARENHLSVASIEAFWILNICGWLGRIWCNLEFAYLDGLGHVGINRAIATVANTANLGALLLLLPLGWGLMAPVVTTAVVAFAMLGLARWLARQYVSPAAFLSGAPDRALIRQLAGDGLKMAVLGLTYYVVTQSCILLVERSEGAKVVAIFAPVARLASMLALAALIPNGMIFPYLTQAWSSGNRQRFLRLSVLTMFFAPAAYLIPGLLLFIWPRELISWWLGPENFVGETVVRGFVAYGLLYTVHSSIALPALAASHRSFVRESVINMALVVVCMPLCALWLGQIGYPVGMIVGTLIPSLMVVWQSLRFMFAK